MGCFCFVSRGKVTDIKTEEDYESKNKKKNTKTTIPI